VSRATIRTVRDLIPDDTRRKGRLLDVGDVAGNGALGMPTRLSMPVLDMHYTLAMINCQPHGGTDVVAMMDSAERFSWVELSIIYSRLYRLLKPGGLLIVTLDEPWWRRMKRWLRMERGRKRYAYTGEQIERALTVAGFPVVASGRYALGAKRYAWGMK